MGGSWRNTPGNGAKRGRTGPAYQAAVQAVRTRAKNGEPCCFCRAGFNWELPTNHRRAFTAHHLHRIMDGGHPIPDAALMAPAHRGCNAADGLRAQNARRARRAAGQPSPIVTTMREPTSRRW